MPDAPQPTQPTATTPSPSPPTEAEPSPAPTPRGLKGSGLRYDDDYPIEFLRGKTADEAAQLAQDFYRRIVTAPQAPESTPAPTPPPPQINGAQMQPPDHQLIYSDSAEYQRQNIAYQQWLTQQALAQAAAPWLAGQAETAKSLSKLDYGDIWKRWGHEIEMEIAGVPQHQRTKHAYDLAAQIVRGRHTDEIAREIADRLQSQSQTAPPTERSTGNGTPLPPSGDSPLDKLWHDETSAYAATLRKNFRSLDEIRSRLPAMGLTEEQFVAATTSAVITETKTGVDVYDVAYR